MAIDPTNKVINYSVFQERLSIQQAAREASNKDKTEKLARKKLTDSSKSAKTKKSAFYLSFEPEEILLEDVKPPSVESHYPDKREKQESNKRENQKEESRLERKAREKCEKAKENLIGAVTAYQKLPINLNNPTWYENLKERFEYHLEAYKSAYLHYAQIANNSPQDTLQSEILQIN